MRVRSNLGQEAASDLWCLSDSNSGEFGGMIHVPMVAMGEAWPS